MEPSLSMLPWAISKYKLTIPKIRQLDMQNKAVHLKQGAAVCPSGGREAVRLCLVQQKQTERSMGTEECWRSCNIIIMLPPYCFSCFFEINCTYHLCSAGAYQCVRYKHQEVPLSLPCAVHERKKTLFQNFCSRHYQQLIF